MVPAPSEYVGITSSCPKPPYFLGIFTFWGVDSIVGVLHEQCRAARVSVSLLFVVLLRIPAS